MKKLLVVFVLLAVSVTAWSVPDLNRTKIIGQKIKAFLESYHYKRLKVDDELSKNAFKEYLKRIDFSKQLLLKSEVEALKEFENYFDDQMSTGQLIVVDEVRKLLKERITKLDDYRVKIFKQTFDYESKEFIELDPEKRDFFSNEEELNEHWRKLYKHDTIIRYFVIQEEEKAKLKDKDKKKQKKKEKQLTEKEMWTKAKEAINKKYKKFFSRLKQEDYDDHIEKFYNSITTVFDPHTTYLPPKRKEDFDIDISGSLEGIGAVLQEDGSYIKVVKIVIGGAAWKQKELEVEDVILAVAQGEGTPTDLVDMRVEDAVRYIRGKKGTEVRLTVKKASGTIKVIPIIRDLVQISESFAKSSILEHEKLKIKVGYIHVPKFYRDFGNNDKEARNCTDDVRKELQLLKKEKVDGVILDLRNNGGGALEDAKQMSGLFIKEGPIVQVRNTLGEVDILKDTDPSVEYAGPLIVMINRFSASASEILSAALQDYDRAIIVGGEYTHGKGTVQVILNLNNGPISSIFGPQDTGALKVTIQKFYRVTGGSTQYKGVTPDIILPDSMGYVESREKDLDYSLRWDEVPKLKYTPWRIKDFPIPVMSEKSKERVQNNKHLGKMVEMVNYFIKRKDETNVPLNITELKKRNEENEKMVEKFKDEELNKALRVSHYEDSFKSVAKINIGKNKKKWKKDFEARKKEWVETLQKDYILEEALYILNDHIALLKQEK